MEKKLAASTARFFWDWFEKNQLAFQFLREMDQEQIDQISDDINRKLLLFCPELHAQARNQMAIGEGYELIISAGGKREFFHKAEELLSFAPHIPQWTYHALEPPLPEGIKIRLGFDGYMLDPDEVWFLPMEAPEQPRNFGVCLFVKCYDDVGDKQQLRLDLLQLLVMVVGERSWAMDIQHLQVAQAPLYPPEHGMRCLYELPEVIADFRKEFPSPHVLEEKQGQAE